MSGTQREATGRPFGRYCLFEEIGRGGMGIVYRAIDEKTGRMVALKTVTSVSERTLGPIRQEIRALSQIVHPGVIRVLDEGLSDGVPWYAMELLDGHSLSVWLDRHSPRTVTQESISGPDATSSGHDSLPRTKAIVEGPGDSAKAVEALPIIWHLCAALSFVHGRGFVHRDLKPSNIFVRTDGTPVLLDFGIAGRWGAAHGREVLDLGFYRMGSPQYMAPEQIKGELIDARADLYSLGCILFEIVTGAPPFVGPSIKDIFRQQLEDPPPSIRGRDVNPALAHLIERLLSKTPHERIGHAEDIARELEQLGVAPALAPAGPVPQPYLYRPEFVGRDDLMASFDDVVANTLAGRGSFHCVGGESGIGKTRLALEVGRRAAQNKLLVVTGECIPVSTGLYGDSSLRSRPFGPFRAFLQAVADRIRARGAAEREKILGPRGPLLAVLEPGLDDTAPAAPVPAVTNAGARDRLIRAMRDTLYAFADVCPVLLILDDLHWADELSVRLLATLRTSDLEIHALAILGTWRTEEEPADLTSVLQSSAAHSSVLSQMDNAAIAQMVGGLLGRPTPPEDLVLFLQTRSTGNPFFVSEYLRAALENNFLRRDPQGRWGLMARAHVAGSSPREELPFPASLRELIAMRLRRVDQTTARLAEVASVLGRDMHPTLLAALSDLDEDNQLARVAELRVKGILDVGSGGRLRFQHDRIRELVYATLKEADRQALHRRAAEVLEGGTVVGSGADNQLAEVANHYREAGLAVKAAIYFRRAGEQAKLIYANDQAAAYYQAAFAEFERTLPKSDGPRPSPQLALEIYEGLADLLALAGRQPEACSKYEECLGRGFAGDALSSARIQRKIAKTWDARHKHQKAFEWYSGANSALGTKPAAAAAEWWSEWTQIQADLLWSHYWRADLGAMQELLARVRPVISERGTPSQLAQFFVGLVNMTLRRDRYLLSDETIDYATAAVNAAEKSLDANDRALARFALGFSCLFAGKLSAAEAELQRALDETQKLGDAVLKARCLTYLTLSHRLMGDVEKTRDCAERSLSVANEVELADYQGSAKANLGWCQLKSGDHEGAYKTLTEAVTIWSNLSGAYPYPMQWTGYIPLWRLRLLEEGEIGLLASDIRREAEKMLAPQQQRFPPSFTDLLERIAGVGSPDPPDLDALVRDACSGAEELRLL
jgi:serine/threonine protein kinase/tetratricopeptide (TPR) repeat protein